MELEEGEFVFDFITGHKLTNCLELGFYHGVSSAYIAAALHEMGTGKLTTIDTIKVHQLQPNIESIISELGLQKYVKYYFEPNSYTWRLMKFLRKKNFKNFDFCYIDGGHTWDTTGFAYFLVSRLLKPGGWLIFDDLNWTHQNPAVSHTDKVKAMAKDEQKAAQVGLVYDLLVKRDPQFTDFIVKGSWGFARKLY